MSLVQLKTQVTTTNSLFAAAGSGGGGGGGGGGDVTFSTITLTGTNPISATLTSSPNDGFEVRNGGGGQNVVTITTMDENNAAQAEMGIRMLSTISGNTSNVSRFEMQADGAPSDVATLTYLLDRAVSGNLSTIGSITFNPGTAPAAGTVKISAENLNGGGNLTIGNGDCIFAPVGANLATKKAIVAGSGNIYVPAAGTTQNVAAFSTIAGHVYELAVPNLRVKNEPAGVPAAGAWCQLTVDTSPAINYVDTFDMASVSTIANDYQKCAIYNFTASGTGHNLQANGSIGNTVSTSITITPALVYLRDLGIPGGMQQIG